MLSKRLYSCVFRALERASACVCVPALRLCVWVRLSMRYYGFIGSSTDIRIQISTSIQNHSAFPLSVFTEKSHASVTNKIWLKFELFKRW